MDKWFVLLFGYVHVTHFCMCNCGLRIISPRHALTEINKVVDDRPPFLAHTPLDTNTLRLKFYQFNFLTICCKLACIIHQQQIDQVEFGLCHVCVCANNQQVMICVAMYPKYRLQHFCLVISLGVQRNMVNFAWGTIARSIGISRYTCLNLVCCDWS